MIRNNAFDLIRHFAAGLVLYSHHYALSGLAEPSFLDWESYGFIAVTLFFAISGYLMTSSFTHSENVGIYMLKRVLRIFPGLLVCAFTLCYIVGGIFSPEPLLAYWSSPETLKNFVSYAMFKSQPIPGVFADFIYKDAINGSLWTLALEFFWYSMLGIALWISNSWKSVFFLLALSIITTLFLYTERLAEFYIYLPAERLIAVFGIAFTLGALLSMTEKNWRPFKWYLALMAILGLCFFKHSGQMFVIGTVAFTLLTIIIGVSCKDPWINGRFDISYGIYIFAFPIQQIVINRITQQFLASLGIAVILSILAAHLSYRWVEKPCLWANIRRSAYFKRFLEA